MSDTFSPGRKLAGGIQRGKVRFMVSASATYFYQDQQRSTDASQERRWRAWEVSSTAAAAWQWAPPPSASRRQG